MSKNGSDDLAIHHPVIGLAARILFTLIFFLSGVTHFTDVAGYASLMPEAIPFRPFWVIISGVVELAGAILILVNRRPRLGAWLIVVFLLPVTFTVHGVGVFTATDEMMQGMQVSMFLKGLAMIGCALLITQLGVDAKGTENP
jgi:uncharacterized membrane protein YphA (DoxX/SURF4 family)